MAVLIPDAEGLRAAVAALAAGELVGMPTETVYGLAADASSEVAVARVFAAKGRPRFDPLIVHLPAATFADELPRWVDASALSAVRSLARALWPGPLTVVAPRALGVLDLVTAGLPTVAVRVPRHPVAQALLDSFGPVVAPSANRFGRISPTTAAHVAAELGDAVAVVLDGGPCAVGVESTVVGLGVGGPTLYRPGGTPRDAVEAVLGPLAAAADPGAKPTSPGQLASHYAPATPVELLDAVDLAPDRCRGAAVLRARAGECPVGAVAMEVLSPSGGDVEAAQRLFGALRRLDAVGAPRIVAERWNDAGGLGPAIDDRLARAAAPRPPSR